MPHTRSLLAAHSAPWHCPPTRCASTRATRAYNSPLCHNAAPHQVCKNPRNPGFNHHLFESVAALIRHVGGSSPAMIDTFEQLLFPAFNHVLQQVRLSRSVWVYLAVCRGKGGGCPFKGLAL